MGTANTLPNLLFVFFFVIHIVLLLIVMFYVLFVCKCVLPPGVNPIAVDKYINTSIEDGGRPYKAFWSKKTVNFIHRRYSNSTSVRHVSLPDVFVFKREEAC
jgi:hypothetical protein